MALLNAAEVLVDETVPAAPETSAAVAAPIPNRKRAAANRASEVVEVSCAPPAKRVALTVATHEATLEEALAARKFSRLVPIESQSMGLEHILVGNHLFSQNAVRFRHVWQGIIQIGNTNAFVIISR